MREEFFDAFITEFGEATTRVGATAEQIEKYRGVLPDELLTVWEVEGFSGYANGLLWITNPADYIGLLRSWLEGTDLDQLDNYHVVARTAFGLVRVWGERQNRTFNLSTASHALYTTRELLEKAVPGRTATKVFFMLMTQSELRWEAPDGGDLFEQARVAHGDLEIGEVYGFEPALAVGGIPDVDHMARLRFDVHASLLRQLAPPRVLELT